MNPPFLLYFLLFLFSCQSIPKGYHRINGEFDATGTESCNALMQKIKKEWAINDTCNCYYYNEKLVKKIITNQSCFIGMDTASVIKIFGKQNITFGKTFNYYFSQNCKSMDSFYSYRMLFIHLKFNKVADIDLYLPSGFICK